MRYVAVFFALVVFFFGGLATGLYCPLVHELVSCKKCCTCGVGCGCDGCDSCGCCDSGKCDKEKCYPKKRKCGSEGCPKK